MVATSNETDLISRLSANFPLTNPIPTPLTHPDLIHVSYISNVRSRINKSQAELQPDVSVEGSLLGPLASEGARRGLQELTMIFERALAIFPTSFKLWKMYMTTRQSYVLGTVTDAATKARRQHALRGARTKTDVTEMLAAAETEYQWEGGLDGLIGYEEWKSLFATGERMLGCLSNVSEDQKEESLRKLIQRFLAPGSLDHAPFRTGTSKVSLCVPADICKENVRSGSACAASQFARADLGIVPAVGGTGRRCCW
jgi:hypothetical protein